ncbi:uncharacterized protein CXQ87_003719 [Candidozyma duobushaemuli]|uniref:Major facilitator superfamily (MFS) profile domain-containing protein n=2 Tax=Candidozyma TaxID=3303203 RepID=A0ABX8I836_9ASCO|nr:uncharacterized protein CXQ87_003719 [[Candida] duobushaemulonis]PVH15862.1 hypothetical protein CXQ87_003719 [[Candida] duobushaemulonis]QWU89436.1 hypothetical protein CA3LBN_003759 [[Candida] haemuloni]
MSAPDPTVDIADAEKPEVEMSSSSLSSKNSYKAMAADRPGQRGNVLAHYTEAETMKMGKEYAAEYNLDEDLFARAAALARCPADFANMDFLTDSEKEQLTLEVTKKWHIPRKLVEVIALGSMAAAVQGMDQSVINGATLFYPDAFGITDMKNADLMEGLINGSPYLCCAICCWTSHWWNRTMGRKWVIFWTCFISAITCVWQGFVSMHWYHLFIARFCMGLGVGVKSATVPAYAAETTPHTIRGSLVMLWQFFTAVGIMFGYVSSLAFYHVGERGIAGGLNWRLMLGSASIPAFIVLFQVPGVPESPRWLMGKGRHQEAFEALSILRRDQIAAARDHFYQYILLQQESSFDGIPYWRRLWEMFTVRRNRNGALGAWIVMFMQQFCGINVIAYYSSSIFIESNLSEVKAMLASWGFGMINFLFAIPAFYTIDTFGRRNLLLCTFPLMSIFLLVAGFSFLTPDENTEGKLAGVATGIYLFAAVYSSGEGPVPFTYSAEAFPLYIRDLGMGFATATCWFFNFILAFTWPRLRNAFTVTGAFGFYAAWNIVGWFLVLLFLPETKGLTLEELDSVFGVSLRKHAIYRARQALWCFRVWILREKLKPMPFLYEHQKRYYQEKGLELDPEISRQISREPFST